jgi:hypothetical protein
MAKTMIGPVSNNGSQPKNLPPTNISIKDLELKAQGQETSFHILKEKRRKTVHQLFRQARIKNGHYIKGARCCADTDEIFSAFEARE